MPSLFTLQDSLLELLIVHDHQISFIDLNISSSPASQSVDKSEKHTAGTASSCVACQIEVEDKNHFKSDFHRYNLKRRINSQSPMTEDAFEELEEVSSIEASSGEDKDSSVSHPSKLKTGSPFAHFHVKGSIPQEELLVYKQVLSSKTKDDVDWLSFLKGLQLRNRKDSWTLIMMASGHFSAAVIDLTSFKPLVHKTFHRYTTRRKQGGAQSSNDKSKGKANSAGAGIRRYNEQALEEEVQQLLKEWKSHIQSSSIIFIRAPNTTRSQLFFDNTILNASDDRIRSFPFITKRPTLKELMRCFEELVSVKQQVVVESTEEGGTTPKNDKKASIIDEVEKKAIEAVRQGHTSVIENMLARNQIDVNAPLTDSAGISFLHIAAEHSQSKMIEVLLEQGADPTKRGHQSIFKPYDLADAKDSRDTFRRFMWKYPNKWDYSGSNIPSPLSPEMEAQAAEKAKEKRKREKDRKRAEKKETAPSVEEPVVEDPVMAIKNVSISKSVKESLGMSAEQRQRLDREKRALAAESRMRSMKNLCGNCKKSLSTECFEKAGFKYCSLSCLSQQQILF